MIFEQLEHLLIERGFIKVPSNLPEFSFFFQGEHAHVNVLHVIDYKQGLYITEDQYVHVKEKIQEFFREKGIKDVHILSLLVSTDTEKAKPLYGEDPFCWMINPIENRLMIYEDQVPDFYGMKDILENFLFEISTQPVEEQAAANAEAAGSFAAGKRKLPWMTILLVVVNVIVFIVCTFTGDLLYNRGDFSVRNLIDDGEWYRILSSMFLHTDVQHLVSNMLVLFYIGNVVEKQIGHLPYIIVYLLSGFAGDLFSAAHELFSGYYFSSVGASGAVFGIEGALLMLALLHKGKVTDVTAGRIVFAIVFSLYCGFTSSYVNNMAHVGGVLMGFVAAGIFWLLLPQSKKEQAGRM